MSVLEFCQWVQYSQPLVAMRSSPWLFPVIATIHLMGLTVIGGAVLLVDLRPLGLGLRRQPVAQLDDPRLALSCLLDAPLEADAADRAMHHSSRANSNVARAMKK